MRRLDNPPRPTPGPGPSPRRELLTTTGRQPGPLPHGASAATARAPRRGGPFTRPGGGWGAPVGGKPGRITVLRFILNVIWLVLSGLWLFLGYALAGIVMCLLIVTIPFGLQAFKLAGFAIWPFGRSVVYEPGRGAASIVGNAIWVVLAGWWLALLHLLSAIMLAVTIVGLPFAWADLKLVPVALLPFGSDVVDAEAARERPGREVTVA